MWSSARSPPPMQVAAAMFTPASLIAAATCASAPGVFSMSMTRSTAIYSCGVSLQAGAGAKLMRRRSNPLWTELDHDLVDAPAGRPRLVRAGNLGHQSLDRSVLAVDETGDAGDSLLAGTTDEGTEESRPQADSHPAIAHSNRKFRRFGIALVPNVARRAEALAGFGIDGDQRLV